MLLKKISKKTRKIVEKTQLGLSSCSGNIFFDKIVYSNHFDQDFRLIAKLLKITGFSFRFSSQRSSLRSFVVIFIRCLKSCNFMLFDAGKSSNT
jgi:hypothetical protein